MGLFGKSKKRARKRVYEQIRCSIMFKKKTFELIIDDIFTIMGLEHCQKKHNQKELERRRKRGVIKNKWRCIRDYNYYHRYTYKRTKIKWLWI